MEAKDPARREVPYEPLEMLLVDPVPVEGEEVVPGRGSRDLRGPSLEDPRDDEPPALGLRLPSEAGALRHDPLAAVGPLHGRRTLPQRELGRRQELLEPRCLDAPAESIEGHRQGVATSPRHLSLPGALLIRLPAPYPAPPETRDDDAERPPSPVAPRIVRSGARQMWAPRS